MYPLALTAPRVGTATVVMFAGAILMAGFTGTAEARTPYPRNWVPQKAWDAVAARAKLDMSAKKVRVYKSRWSKRVSKGLRSASGQDAYIVHAKKPAKGVKRFMFWNNKKKGTYLVQKSSQGIYEAHPVAPNSKGKHVSKINSRKPKDVNAFTDGGFPPGKLVHGVKVSGASAVNTDKGRILARTKRTGRLQDHLVFVQGEGRGNQVTTTLSMSQRMPWFRPFMGKAAAKLPSIGIPRPPIMPPYIQPPTKADVKVNQLMTAYR